MVEIGFFSGDSYTMLCVCVLAPYLQGNEYVSGWRSFSSDPYVQRIDLSTKNVFVFCFYLLVWLWMQPDPPFARSGVRTEASAAGTKCNADDEANTFPPSCCRWNFQLEIGAQICI